MEKSLQFSVSENANEATWKVMETHGKGHSKHHIAINDTYVMECDAGK